MPARTLEDKRNQALEHVEISAHMIRKNFNDTLPTMERLQWTADRLAEAIELQKKIDKRDARTPQFDDLIDWSSRAVQTIEIPGERRGVLTTRSTSWAAAVRRAAKRRGLTAHVTITNGAAAHVRLVG